MRMCTELQMCVFVMGLFEQFGHKCTMQCICVGMPLYVELVCIECVCCYNSLGLCVALVCVHVSLNLLGAMYSFGVLECVLHVVQTVMCIALYLWCGLACNDAC